VKKIVDEIGMDEFTHEDGAEVGMSIAFCYSCQKMWDGDGFIETPFDVTLFIKTALTRIPRLRDLNFYHESCPDCQDDITVGEIPSEGDMV
jgi:hypothetical protein